MEVLATFVVDVIGTFLMMIVMIVGNVLGGLTIIAPIYVCWWLWRRVRGKKE